jgi:hypothetical protein
MKWYFRLLVFCWVPNLWADGWAQSPSLVIQEIMADPSPAQGLPQVEYVELRNLSGGAVSLQGWTLSDGHSIAVIQSPRFLQADSCIIITSSTGMAQLQRFGTVIGLANFPSLNNEGDSLVLRDARGRASHAVAYDISWYRDPIKAQGGWSLEMMDVQRSCIGAENWTASNALLGGTPGQPGQYLSRLEPLRPPTVTQTWVANPYQAELIFAERVDSGSVVQAGHIRGLGSLPNPNAVLCVSPWFQKAIASWQQPVFFAEHVYGLSVEGVKSCTGDSVRTVQNLRVGLAIRPDTNDLRLNEILFEPVSGSVPFIELYHAGKSTVDLAALWLANRGPTGQLINLRALLDRPMAYHPGQYLLITSDLAVLKKYHRWTDSALVIETTLPSLPDDEGQLVLLYKDGSVLDEIHYQSDWHSTILTSTRGVSLERIKTNGITQDKHNWHSGSLSTGYATPGYRNAQDFSINTQTVSSFRVPEWFSPNHDGRDDLLLIEYQFPNPGMMCHLAVYHQNGILVKTIEDHALCGRTGFFQWDGTQDNGEPAPTGHYILWIETYNGDGQVKKYKQALALIAQ